MVVLCPRVRLDVREALRLFVEQFVGPVTPGAGAMPVADLVIKDPQQPAMKGAPVLQTWQRLQRPDTGELAQVLGLAGIAAGPSRVLDQAGPVPADKQIQGFVIARLRPPDQRRVAGLIRGGRMRRMPKDAAFSGVFLRRAKPARPRPGFSRIHTVPNEVRVRPATGRRRGHAAAGAG